MNKTEILKSLNEQLKKFEKIKEHEESQSLAVKYLYKPTEDYNLVLLDTINIVEEVLGTEAANDLEYIEERVRLDNVTDSNKEKIQEIINLLKTYILKIGRISEIKDKNGIKNTDNSNLAVDKVIKFRDLLNEHNELWLKSLGRAVKSYPEANIRELKEQQKKLTALLYEIDEYLKKYSKSRYGSLAGRDVDIYEDAIGDGIAPFKGPCIDKAILDIEGVIAIMKNDDNPKAQLFDNFWMNINAEIVKVSKKTFDTNNYKESVFNAFVEVNNKVKMIYKKRTGTEDDGLSLMFKAFGFDIEKETGKIKRTPIIPLSDLSTQTGKDIQEGYKFIFGGSISAVRNPKGHQNFTITKPEAIHFIYLASLLMNKLDEIKG